MYIWKNRFFASQKFRRLLRASANSRLQNVDAGGMFQLGKYITK